jgi:cytochrome c5
MGGNGTLTVALVLGMLTIILLACSQASSQQQQSSTQTAVAQGQQAYNGASLLESRCSVCHSADRAKSKKKDRAGWEKTVLRMISNGANLSDTEKSALIDYLAKNYPAK